MRSRVRKRRARRRFIVADVAAWRRKLDSDAYSDPEQRLFFLTYGFVRRYQLRGGVL
jgi:hypothetical protein